jgi:hypothetical protein
VAQLNPKLANDLELADQVELILKHDGVFENEAQKNDTDLKREAVQKYLQIQTSLDHVESLVGQW